MGENDVMPAIISLDSATFGKVEKGASAYSRTEKKGRKVSSRRKERDDAAGCGSRKTRFSKGGFSCKRGRIDRRSRPAKETLEKQP